MIAGCCIMFCFGPSGAYESRREVLRPRSRKTRDTIFERSRGNGMRRPASIAPPKGKLGVLLPGMGAVSTTFMAGVELVRRGESLPVGSLTQMATIRLGKRTDARTPKIKEFVPLAE